MNTDRKAVTQDMVNSAAESIVQRGDKPTVEAVRRELGDFGSYSTLTRFLREWRESRKEEVPKRPPPELPEELVTPVLQSLRMAAFQLEEKATARISDIQKDSETKRSEITDELRYATNEITRLERVETKDKTEIKQLKKELESAKLATAADKERITILEQEKIAEHKKAETASTELTTVKERLQNMETECRQLVGEKKSIEKELSSTGATLAQANSTIEGLKEQLVTMSKDKESLQSNLEKLKKRAVELTGDLKNATKLSDESTKKHSALLEKFEKQSTEITEIKIGNGKLETRIEATNEERDRLAKLLEAMSKKDNPK